MSKLKASEILDAKYSSVSEVYKNIGKCLIDLSEKILDEKDEFLISGSIIIDITEDGLVTIENKTKKYIKGGKF